MRYVFLLTCALLSISAIQTFSDEEDVLVECFPANNPEEVMTFDGDTCPRGWVSTDSRPVKTPADLPGFKWRNIEPEREQAEDDVTDQ